MSFLWFFKYWRFILNMILIIHNPLRFDKTKQPQQKKIYILCDNVEVR
jgi:hypothetical protein